MTSVNSQFAQRLTKNLIVNSVADSPKFFTSSDLSDLVADNKPNVTKLGSSYIVKASVIETVLTNFQANGASFPAINATLKDMGKEVRIGTPTEASLVVLRLVQVAGPVDNNGTPDDYDADGTAYVVVENNVDDPAVTNTDLQVRVARV